MKRKILPTLFNALALVALATGCNQQSSPQPQQASSQPRQSSPQTQSTPRQRTPEPAYFQTPFQTESQYVVETVVSDIAEQLYYAANHKLPDPKAFSVTATENPGPPTDTPTYHLQIGLDQQRQGIKLDVNINGPIWSADVYRTITAALAKAAGAKPSQMILRDSPAFITGLLDGTGETIEQQNQSLSDALEQNFVNPRLHEQAAVLLGAFMLRERSGKFYDVKAPLCRLTAHLAMAQFLEGTNSVGVNGRMAEAMMLTLVKNESAALARLKTFDTNDTTLASMVRVLQARNTGDFRALSKTANPAQIESVACFFAMADYADSTVAWQKLDRLQRQTIDFVRSANDLGYSVETGHELLRAAIPLELREEQNIYKLSHGYKRDWSGTIQTLNEMPERCFTTGRDGQLHVRVIGWGQWAAFLQRELCHAVQQNYYFMNSLWGVPDDAKKFAAQCDDKFARMRLYPFVDLFFGRTGSQSNSIEAALKATVTAPQLVPAACWIEINKKGGLGASNVVLIRDPHIYQWYNHNPLPGTVYDINPRMRYQLSPINGITLLARLEQLHQMAPYSEPIIGQIIQWKFPGKQPPYDVLLVDYYRDLMPWSVNALRKLANATRDKPDEYEKLMLQAATLSPTCYYDLSSYFERLKNDEKMAEYMEKACQLDGDSVRVSNYAPERVRYYMKKGQVDKAREIADFAGEVYSGNGLIAKGLFLEMTSNYPAAFETYANLEERYQDSSPLVEFCVHYRGRTKDLRYEPELQKRFKVLFPRGIEKVCLSDFNTAPNEGVSIRNESDLLRAANMKAGDVIVALNGTRVYNNTQFKYVRATLVGPEMDLVVWQGDGYHEIKASPPDHQFGVLIGHYQRH